MSKVKIFIFSSLFFLSAFPVFAQVVDTAWVRRYNGLGDGSDEAGALTVDGSGNVYVAGGSWSGTSFDYATIKYAPNGDTLWVRRYNGPGNGDDIVGLSGIIVSRPLAVDDSGNVYVTGGSYDSVSFYDYATIKYAPNGDTLWVRRYNGPLNGDDVAFALAVDGSGNVYVTGGSIGPSPCERPSDYATIKYAPNGDTVWVRRYNGPGNCNNVAWALAVDDSGNVYVTGASDGIGTLADYATIKYAPNGDELWVRRYNAPENDNDIATALAVDGSGNVYVTGGNSAGDTITVDDYTTIKYAPNGDTLWVRRYNGPGNNNDYANAIAVDNSGDVYVTGYSIGSGSAYDYATIKYAPNGDTLWVRRYNGQVNGHDFANGLAVDGSGNVCVTGASDGAGIGTSPDYATIKYSPNGDTLWVRRYIGPSGQSGFGGRAFALAVDGSGNVYVTGAGFDGGVDYVTIKYSTFYQLPIRQDTLVIIAYSPVNLVVTDPTNDSIGLDTTGTRPDTIFNTILEGSTYDTTQDVSVPPDGKKDDVVRIPKPYVGQYKIRVLEDGVGTYSLGIRIDGSDQVFLANNKVVPVTDTTYTYSVYITLRGDVNKDKSRNLTDIISLVNYVFKGGPAPDPKALGDVNCTGGNPILPDVIYMVNYVFKGGKAPCS